MYIAVDAFKRLNLGIKDILAEASERQKSLEWEKIQAEFLSLKNRLVSVVGIDHSKDVTQLNEKFMQM